MIGQHRQEGDEPDRLREELQAEIEELTRERDEARDAARFCYWNMPTLPMHLPTGKYWYQQEYPWLLQGADNGKATVEVKE